MKGQYPHNIHYNNHYNNDNNNRKDNGNDDRNSNTASGGIFLKIIKTIWYTNVILNTLTLLKVMVMAKVNSSELNVTAQRIKVIILSIFLYISTISHYQL